MSKCFQPSSGETGPDCDCVSARVLSLIRYSAESKVGLSCLSLSIHIAETVLCCQFFTYLFHALDIIYIVIVLYGAYMYILTVLYCYVQVLKALFTCTHLLLCANFTLCVYITYVCICFVMRPHALAHCV